LLTEEAPGACEGNQKSDTSPTLANFGAQICEFANREDSIIGAHDNLLAILGNLPNVQETSPGIWAGPIFQVFARVKTQAAEDEVKYLQDLRSATADEIANVLIEASGLEDDLPCTTAGVNALVKAANDDADAISHDASAQKALSDGFSGSTGSTMEAAIGEISLASLSLSHKLADLADALDRLGQDCASQSDATFQAEIAFAAAALRADREDLLAAIDQHLGLVPGSGWILFRPNLVIEDPALFPEGLLPAQDYPSGVSTTDAVVVQPMPNLPVSGSGTLPGGTVIGGGTISVSGSGFAGGTPVNVVGSSQPTLLGKFTANANGSFSGQVALPSHTEPGTHELYAIGKDGGGDPRILGKTVQVESAYAPNRCASLAVEPRRIDLKCHGSPTSYLKRLRYRDWGTLHPTARAVLHVRHKGVYRVAASLGGLHNESCGTTEGPTYHRLHLRFKGGQTPRHAGAYSDTRLSCRG
jgi:hypothetical protein